MSSPSIRVRIAPSPTGNLHIGTARTTLFNYLFARHHGGQLILRIEDTDLQRSQAHFTQNILEGLRGLGLSWDEGPDVGGPYGPYFQSQRTAIYLEALAKLEKNEKIYPCFCTEQELQAERQQAEASGKTYVYSGTCRHLSPEERLSRIQAGEKPVWRLKVPSQSICFEDLIRGPIEIHSDLIGDIIIAKSDRSPIYNFAVVVDDIAMRITHVLRGEDHISNTPKQILIYQALEAPLPAFGHFPMILAPDRSKLSKRHGATSVLEYLEKGFLAEALINYLALLGWSAPQNREILSLEELSTLFHLESINKSGAIFDLEKLTWLNGQWIRRLSPALLLQRLQPFMQQAGLNPADYDSAWLEQVIALVQEKCRVLPDFLEHADFLFWSEPVRNMEQVRQALSLPSASDVLQAFYTALSQLSHWEQAAIEQIVARLKTELPYKTKEIMWPLRAALTGRTAGADLQQSILLLGKEKTLQRLQLTLAQLANFN